MTVAAKESLAGGGKRGPIAASPWRRLWQVPLLLVGVAAFAVGLRTYLRTIKPIPFGQQAAAVRSLIEAEQYKKAIEELNRIGPHYQEPAQKGVMQQYIGDAIYLSQQNEPVAVRENYRRVEEHYRMAVAWGVEPSARMNERWGVAALALGDARTAVEKLEAAIEASGHDPAMIQRHTRELAAAYLEAGERDKARAIVEKMLAALKAAPPKQELDAMDEATWCLCKRIEIALEGRDEPGLKSAIEGAREAIKEFKERDPQGRVLVWIGRAELERGDTRSAEADLTAARGNFAVRHLDDGRAAVLLGRLAISRGALDPAAALFEDVCMRHAGTPVWAAARLGRADVMSRKGILTGDALLADYRYAIATLREMEKAPVGKKPEFMAEEDVRNSLFESYARAREAGKFEAALTFLELERQTESEVSADNAYRRATTRELLAEEELHALPVLKPAEAAAKLAEARHLMELAADDYLQHASLTTLNDDISGRSLWKGAELLDRAGATARAIEIYEKITIQRPRDGRVSEGLLALGVLYESAGMIDKALSCYARNVKENPNASAAYKSQINQARCHVALAKRSATMKERQVLLEKAEKTLLGLVQDNTNLLPNAREFHDSLLALADLYYYSYPTLAAAVGSSAQTAPATATAGVQTQPGGVMTDAVVPVRGRWSDAILRIDEFLERYPDDPQTARMVFMLAESYRQSALEIGEAMRSETALSGRSELERARMERLLTATDYFSRVIALLDSELAVVPQTAHSLTALEETYLRTAYMDRAQCHFVRGDFEQAIRRYTEAAARFSEEVLAVDAYVQIVNAYLAMKQPAQAAAAADRGRWILKRVPDAAFAQLPAGGAGRGEYEKLLSMK